MSKSININISPQYVIIRFPLSQFEKIPLPAHIPQHNFDAVHEVSLHVDRIFLILDIYDHCPNGEHYYDGCNWCYCIKREAGPPLGYGCTLRSCQKVQIHPGISASASVDTIQKQKVRSDYRFKKSYNLMNQSHSSFNCFYNRILVQKINVYCHSKFNYNL